MRAKEFEENMMPIFLSNFEYIRNSMEKVIGSKMRLKTLANLFEVKKLTVYGWVSKNRMPLNVTLKSIVDVTNKKLKWDLTVKELLNEDISKKYLIENKIKEKKESVEYNYISNAINMLEIDNRLKQLRKDKGWTLMNVVVKMFDLYPKDKEYRVSHTYITEIENHKLLHYSVSKLIALATVYDTTVDYILFGKKAPESISVDRKNKALVIPLSKKLLDQPNHEIINIAEKIYKLIHDTLLE